MEGFYKLTNEALVARKNVRLEARKILRRHAERLPLESATEKQLSDRLAELEVLEMHFYWNGHPSSEAGQHLWYERQMIVYELARRQTPAAYDDLPF
jgi:hypothetical protein